MKKNITVLLCLILLAAAVMPASAAVLKPAVKLETGRVIDGMFPVYVYLIDCKGLSASDMVIAYNSQAITYECCEKGRDMLAVANTLGEEINYDVNDTSPSGLRISFFFKTALATAEEYASDAKKGAKVEVNTAKFQIFELWFSIPENAAETANINVSAKMMIKKTEKIYTSTLSFKPSLLPVYTPVRGDVDLDEKVTAADARLALRCAVKLENLTGRSFLNADMDCDSVITASDARRILRIAVNLFEVDHY